MLVVKPMQRMAAMRGTSLAEEAAGPTEVELLTEIRDELRQRTPPERAGYAGSAARLERLGFKARCRSGQREAVSRA